MKILPTPAARRLLPLAVFLALPSAVTAQSAKEILMTSFEEYEQRMEGIASYTVVQETMGFETELTFVQTKDDEGRTVFVLKGQEEASGGGMSNFYRMYPKIAERAELEGRESVDGEQCHILAINDFSGLDLDQEMGPRGDFVPKTGVLYVDTDDHLIRKMALEGEITADGETRPMTAVTVLSDYREVEGMLHPFLLQITATGLAAGMSEEEAEEARKSLAEMEKNLEGMDDTQRAMVERMMGGQLEKLRKMLESGQFELTVVTKEVRVNESLE